MANPFELFGLIPAYALDAQALDEAYRRMQSQVHPDRFASAGDAERRASMQWTTRVNEAYRTLKDPVQRGKHLLALQGVDVAFETNTQMPTEFLMQQLELRERLEEAIARKDAAALDALGAELASQRDRLEREVAATIDEKRDYPAAADLVRKLMFLQRIGEEVDAAYETVLA